MRYCERSDKRLVRCRSTRFCNTFYNHRRREVSRNRHLAIALSNIFGSRSSVVGLSAHMPHRPEPVARSADHSNNFRNARTETDVSAGRIVVSANPSTVNCSLFALPWAIRSGILVDLYGLPTGCAAASCRGALKIIGGLATSTQVSIRDPARVLSSCQAGPAVERVDA